MIKTLYYKARGLALAPFHLIYLWKYAILALLFWIAFTWYFDIPWFALRAIFG